MASTTRTTAQDFSVAIVGGGIGGLMCTISLKKAGIAFDIFEAAAQFGEVGAGIGFAPNAEVPLKYMGLWDDYMAASIPRERYTVLLGNETRDHITDLSSSDGMAVSSIHRAHLVDLLVKHLPPESAHLHKRATKVERLSQDADPIPRYRIHFLDRTTHDADLVIGADGIKSVVRDAVLSRRVEPCYAGTRAFRGLFPADAWFEAIGPEYSSGLLVVSGLGKHLIIFPIDGNKINFVAFISDPLDKRFSDETSYLPPKESWVRQADPEEGAKEFADMTGLHAQLPFKLIKDMTVWKIHTLWPPLPTYVNGGVAILGDAAHGMTPHCGQGAGQALEDSFILGRLLGHPKTTLKTLQRTLRIYDQVRRPRGNKVLEYSLETGDVWDGWGPSGDSFAGRKQDCTDRLDWIWRHDVEADWVAAKEILESDL